MTALIPRRRGVEGKKVVVGELLYCCISNWRILQRVESKRRAQAVIHKRKRKWMRSRPPTATFSSPSKRRTVKSSVSQVLLQIGKVLVIHKMGSSLFDEGLTLLRERSACRFDQWLHIMDQLRWLHASTACRHFATGVTSPFVTSSIKDFMKLSGTERGCFFRLGPDCDRLAEILRRNKLWSEWVTMYLQDAKNSNSEPNFLSYEEGHGADGPTLSRLFSDALSNGHSHSPIDDEYVEYSFDNLLDIPTSMEDEEWITKQADFFTFGISFRTNDLTQLTFSNSRYDFGKFRLIYLSKGLLQSDTFEGQIQI